MNRVIEITVSPEGQATVETKGFVGSACRDASKFVEEALGKRLSEKLNSEFYQQPATEQQQQQGH